MKTKNHLASELKENACTILFNQHYHNSEERGVILLEKIRQYLSNNQKVRIYCDGRPNVVEGFISRLKFGQHSNDTRDWWIGIVEDLYGNSRERVISFNNMFFVEILN